MALQVWLPLCGNLKNLGLTDVSFYKQDNLKYNINGKLGSCLQFDGNANQILSISNAPQLKSNFSWCCWVCQTSRTATSGGTSTTTQYILSEGRDCGVVGVNLRILNGNLNVFIGSAKNTESTDTATATASSISVSTLALDTWYHVTLAVNQSQIKIYLNGKLTKTANLVDINYATGSIAVNSYFTIGKLAHGHTNTTTHFPLAGYINDVRIYDTCLSEEEIRQISQGLITHYPLSDPYGEYYTNLYSGEQAFGGADTAGGFTKTKKKEEGEIYHNYSGSHSASSTGNQWYYLNFKTYTFTPGKSYFISFKMRTNSCTNMSLTFRHSRVYNDYKGCKSKVVVSSSTSSKWTEYYLIQVIPESFVYDGTVNTCAPLLEFYTNNLASLDCSMDFDLKDVMVVESDHYLPFVSRSTNGIVYDISGYGYHATAASNTTPAYSSETPIGNGSYIFNGVNSFIACGRNSMVKDGISINIWACMENWSKFERLLSCTEGGGWNFEPSGGYLQFSIGTGQSSNVYFMAKDTTALSALSGWHMFTGTYDGYRVKLYRDGKLITTKEAYTTKTPAFYHPSNGVFIGAEAGGNQVTPVGNYFNGQITDVRIYATALSPDDILSLYQRRFVVSTEADLYCSEFIENDGITNLSRVGILSVQNIVEMDGMDYVKQLSTLSYTPTKSTNSCISAYRFYQADAGVITGDTVTIELDVEWSGFDTSNTDGTFNIRFQGERYKPDGSYEWSSNPYTTALNNKYYLKTLVLSSESGHYHYVATTETFTSDLADFSSMTIGLRSDYSNGTGKITLSNCKAYKTQYYLGEEKTRMTSNEVIANEFIEF